MDYQVKLELQRQNKSLENLLKKVEEIEKKINPTEKLLDSTEVMKLLGVSQRTLATYRKDGRIQFTKVGGSVRYPQSAINNIIFSNLKN